MCQAEGTGCKGPKERVSLTYFEGKKDDVMSGKESRRR